MPRNHWRYIQLPCGRDMFFQFAEPFHSHDGYLKVSVFEARQHDPVPDRKWRTRYAKIRIPSRARPSRSRSGPIQLSLFEEYA